MNQSKEHGLNLRGRLACHVARGILYLLKKLKRQASTFPGEVARRIDPKILKRLAALCRVIVVTGTNGKTTTAMIVTDLLREMGLRVLSNSAGANLETGLITALLHAQAGDLAVLEVDEASFGKCAAALAPEQVLVTNLFRDQLDRYGELDAVYRMIEKGIREAKPQRLILLADDAKVNQLGEAVADHGTELWRFGWDMAQTEADTCTTSVNTASDATESDIASEKTAQQERRTIMRWTDAALCPNCGFRLKMARHLIAHTGDYRCEHCGLKRVRPNFSFFLDETGLFKLHFDPRPQDEHTAIAGEAIEGEAMAPFESAASQSPLEGRFNAYNLAAALSLAKSLCPQTSLQDLLNLTRSVKPRFGRLERFSLGQGRSVCFLLVKNPAGYAESLHFLEQQKDLGGLMFLLNDNWQDGRDISWIWDVPFEMYPCFETPHKAVAGTRAEDLALRLSIWGLEVEKDRVLPEDQACELVFELLSEIPEGTCLYILPNYTALLHLRGQVLERLGLSSDWVGAKERPVAAASMAASADSAAAETSASAADTETPAAVTAAEVSADQGQGGGTHA